MGPDDILADLAADAGRRRPLEVLVKAISEMASDGDCACEEAFGSHPGLRLSARHKGDGPSARLVARRRCLRALDGWGQGGAAGQEPGGAAVCVWRSI